MVRDETKADTSSSPYPVSNSSAPSLPFSSVMHIYVYLGIVGLILATLPFIGYDLTREMHDKCVKEIAEREAKAAGAGLMESEVAAQ